jgi:succinyl-CoA synthetase beta subunit
MRLIEADGKELLRRAGLPVPANARLLGPDDELELRLAAVVKAQVLEGGRGKAGLVKLVSHENMANDVEKIRQTLRERGDHALVLIEDQVTFEQEFYIGWRIDDVAQQPALMFSTQGGVEIESHPDTLRQYYVNPLNSLQPHDLVPFLRDAGVGGRTLGAVSRFAVDLYRIFRAEDADLLEINPLGVTAQGAVVALDCKMSVDNAAVARHPYWHSLISYRLRHAGMTTLEARADDAGITFVELPGNVALLSGGAGLGLALVDLLAESGFAAANFCDTVGGSGMAAFSRMTELVFDRAEHPDVEAIVAFFTLSATSLKPAVISLVEAIRCRTLSKPIIVGFAATGAALREMTVDQAVAAFAELGYPCVTELSDLMDALRTRIGHGPAWVK